MYSQRGIQHIRNALIIITMFTFYTHYPTGLFIFKSCGLHGEGGGGVCASYFTT